MAVISTIASTSQGCGGDAVNTGELGCDIEFGLVIHALAFVKGFSIPADTDLTQDYIDTEVQAGNIIPLMDAFSSEPTIADDTLETSPLGVEALTLKGLPKYMLTMKKGQYYYKQMAKLTSFGNLNYVLGDVNGNWKFALLGDGSYGGFTAGQTLSAITVPATATETEKKSFTFQLTDRNQIDVMYSVVLAANAFPISEVTGVNGVELSFADANGAVPPADTDTTLKVHALLAADRHTGMEGYTDPNFLYTVDGATVAATVVDDGDGYYTLTVAAIASAELLTLRLYDSSVNKDVVVVSNVLSRSNILTATVA
jgi:hypothetical protein